MVYWDSWTVSLFFPLDFDISLLLFLQIFCQPQSHSLSFGDYYNYRCFRLSISNIFNLHIEYFNSVTEFFSFAFLSCSKIISFSLLNIFIMSILTSLHLKSKIWALLLIWLLFPLTIHSILLTLKVKVKVAQFCPTLWDPMDYTVHGIL